MAITDDELDAKREHVEKLRLQVAQEEAKRYEREAGLVNDVTAAQLDAEATRLEAQLVEAKRVNKAAEVRGGAATVLDAVKEEQRVATERLKAEQALADAAGSRGDAKADQRDAQNAADEADRLALEKAAEANAKAPAPAATNVPEGSSGSTVKTTDDTKER